MTPENKKLVVEALINVWEYIGADCEGMATTAAEIAELMADAGRAEEFNKKDAATMVALREYRALAYPKRRAIALEAARHYA